MENDFKKSLKHETNNNNNNNNEVTWFTEEELELINKNRENYVIDSKMPDEYPTKSYDMSYLLTEEERKKIFERTILGIKENDTDKEEER